MIFISIREERRVKGKIRDLQSEIYHLKRTWRRKDERRIKLKHEGMPKVMKKINDKEVKISSLLNRLKK